MICMKVQVDLILTSVQVIRRGFDKQGRVQEEQIEYYSPAEKRPTKLVIGFKANNKKK